MYLGFMRKWPATKEPTLFPELIWLGLLENSRLKHRADHFQKYSTLHQKKYGKPFQLPVDRKPKLHTIRRDKKERWHEGLDIHFVTGNRYKKGGDGLFQFAPVMKPESIQEVFMSATGPRGIEITVGDKYLYWPDIERLAINDGFLSVEAFREYFLPAGTFEFSGRIIHWTKTTY